MTFRTKWVYWNKKTRATKEIIERLSLINLIVKISFEWKLDEIRENQKFEKTLFFIKTYKIVLNISWVNFKIILWEKEYWDIVLLSCFVGNYSKEKQKKINSV